MSTPLQIHESAKSQIQELLNYCLDLAAELDLLESGGSIEGVTEEGVFVKVSLSFLDKKFVHIAWLEVDSGDGQGCKLQFDGKSRLVADSARFHAKGWYLGVGHIQFAPTKTVGTVEAEGEYAAGLLSKLKKVFSWEVV